MINHRSGFVSIIGNPNSGKSTLLNALVGKKISIVTKKAQTTRHRIFGIYNEINSQIIFSDTPGFIIPRYELQTRMMSYIKKAFKDSDVILFLIAINDFYEQQKKFLIELMYLEIPVFILINKIDLLINTEMLEKNVEHWHKKFPKSLILPISAKKKINLNFIIDKIKQLIPFSPPYYDKNQITDRSKEFFISESIRKQILINYNKEIPYSVEVITELFYENSINIIIESIIYVERYSQKKIIIGYKESALSRLVKLSQLEIQKLFKKITILNIYIKVKKNWRKNNNDLNKFGYLMLIYKICNFI